jgi:transposase
MSTTRLRDEQWLKILAFLRQHRRVYVGKESNCRRFLEAVLWLTRTGAQWREIPPERGEWNSVYKRFARWSDHGVWEEMHAHFADDPDMESVIFDSTVVRAHACAAGAPQKTVKRKSRPLDAVVAVSAPKSMSLSML